MRSSSLERDPERVLGVSGRGHSTKYLVRFSNQEQPEWVPYRLMQSNQELVREFKREQMRRYLANYSKRKREEKQIDSGFSKDVSHSSGDENTGVPVRRRGRPPKALESRKLEQSRPRSVEEEEESEDQIMAIQDTTDQGLLPDIFRKPSLQRQMHMNIVSQLETASKIDSHFSLNGQVFFKLDSSDGSAIAEKALYPYDLVEQYNPRVLLEYLKQFIEV